MSVRDDVIRLRAEGLTMKVIADRLGVSTTTVHRYSPPGVRCRTPDSRRDEVLRYAEEHPTSTLREIAAAVGASKSFVRRHLPPRGNLSGIEPFLVERIVELRLAGHTIQETAELVGVHPNTVARRGPKGLPRRRYRVDVAEIRRLRDSGHTYKQIAHIVGVGEGSVGRALRHVRESHTTT